MEKQKSSLALPLSIIIVGVLIAGAVYYSNTKKSTSDQPADPGTELVDSTIEKKDEILSAGHLRGSSDAKIVIAEFSDPQCPFCAEFHTTMEQVFDQFGKDGTVAWRYIHFFPFDARPDAHPFAREYAEALECAADVGGEDAFWDFLKNIFTSQENADLQAIATSLSLDVKAFNTCVESKTFTEKVNAEHDLATSLGLRGTPHTLVILEDGTGYSISGAYPIQIVGITLDAAVAGVKADKIQKFLDLFREPGITEATINAYIQQEFVPFMAPPAPEEES